MPPRPVRKALAAEATSADTKTRILDAAERLFVEHGFEATSLRQLTTAAGVNLAAVNYHFGSKEELFQAVLTRRLDPMNQERIERLEKLEREASGKPLSCEKILFAMLIPALRLARDERREQRLAVREAAVQRRARDARARGDVVERRAPQPVRGELLAGGLENPLGVRVELLARAGDEARDWALRAHAARAFRASRSNPARAIGM